MIDLADDEFGKGDCGENKTITLSALSTSKNPTEAGYLISGTKKTFDFLQHAFIQTPIFQYFDLERHIRIKTYASGYAISGVLSQLTLDDLC